MLHFDFHAQHVFVAFDFGFEELSFLYFAVQADVIVLTYFEAEARFELLSGEFHDDRLVLGGFAFVVAQVGLCPFEAIGDIETLICEVYVGASSGSSHTE